MLVNATQPEELRVAIVAGQKLDNLDIEHNTREQRRLAPCLEI
jgi:ribonuclease E